VHDLSAGIPRRINNICNLALLLGASRGQDRVDEMIVYEVSRTLEGEY
jgi:type II secretory pathway predicted ATPase ExeA